MELKQTFENKTNNILNPNLAFLPTSPLYMPEKVNIDLWNKIKKEILVEKVKKDKKFKLNY
jgi:hypothetical protein